MCPANRFLQTFQQKHCMYYPSHHTPPSTDAYLMPCPSTPPLFHHSNNSWKRKQVLKFLIRQFSAAKRYFLPHRYKYLQEEKYTYLVLLLIWGFWAAALLRRNVFHALGYTVVRYCEDNRARASQQPNWKHNDKNRKCALNCTHI